MQKKCHPLFILLLKHQTNLKCNSRPWICSEKAAEIFSGAQSHGNCAALGSCARDSSDQILQQTRGVLRRAICLSDLADNDHQNMSRITEKWVEKKKRGLNVELRV